VDADSLPDRYDLINDNCPRRSNSLNHWRTSAGEWPTRYRAFFYRLSVFPESERFFMLVVARRQKIGRYLVGVRWQLDWKDSSMNCFWYREKRMKRRPPSFYEPIEARD
jgi:hypothetical protein